MSIPSAFSRYDTNDFGLPQQQASQQQQPKFSTPSIGVTDSDFNIAPQKQKTSQGMKTNQPAQKADLSQNEQDMLNGPIMQELGINFGMVFQKLKTSLPFVQIPQEVSEYPEMVFSFIILIAVFVISIFSSANLHSFIPLMFGAMIYGSILFKTLINLLLQGQKSVDIYFMMSAICYSLSPIIICWFAMMFVTISFPVYIVVSIPVCVFAAYILQKHLDAIVGIENVKILISAPAFIYSAFWLLMGRGLAI
ncbi:Yip [Hexamita inflata]|uniref:Yip n=1 Tax=Hexamita inflata TaxID=28002 RepID=A0AA86TTH8_9EUKA|nr:Yip [Hexamita inflata]